MGSADRSRKARYVCKRKSRSRQRGSSSSSAAVENENDIDFLSEEVAVPPTVDDVSTVADTTPQENVTLIEGLPTTDEGIPGPSTQDKEDNELEMYFFMNLSILKSIIELVGQCPECKNNTVSVSINTDRKKGFAQEILLECTCLWTHTVFSSHRIKDGKSNFDINLRTVMAFREIGQGLASIETFCRLMNTTPPMTTLSYAETINDLHASYTKAAEESMSSAAAAVVGDDGDSPTDIVASFDGSWQRRGYSSLNGVVTCIERVNDKCIDVAVKTKDCKSCTYWEKLKGTKDYDVWKSGHQCAMNHTGSASAMETAGTLEMFKRSIETHNLRYTTFIGDGDSSSYPAVVQEDPYSGTSVDKGECVGHVQKRVGTNLNKMRKALPKERKKCIFGKGKLTNAAINYIQNCYGLAIRQNTNNLYQMKKNVGAILFHCSDIKPDEERHRWCPRGDDSWCSFWNPSKKGKMKLNLPTNIKDEPEIKKLFDRLRDESLLSKCLHGKTQNVNESLNGIIWTRCPKRVYVTKKTLEICVSSAVLEFNDGKDGINKVMMKAGLKVGHLQSELSKRVVLRHKRVKKYKSAEPVKKRRKTLRALKKHWSDIDKEVEGKTYEAGGF